MKDSKKNLSRHNRLEANTLIRIVVGGGCPENMTQWGRLSYEEIVQVQISGCNFPRWELPRG